MDNVLSHPNISARDVSDALKNLVREELITDEQYDSLSKDDNLDMDKLITEIKRMKIGRGIDFLPRKTEDLLAKLKEWSMKFVENGTEALQGKILAVLDELLFRKVITKEKRKDISKDMGCL